MPFNPGFRSSALQNMTRRIPGAPVQPWEDQGFNWAQIGQQAPGALPAQIGQQVPGALPAQVGQMGQAANQGFQDTGQGFQGQMAALAARQGFGRVPTAPTAPPLGFAAPAAPPSPPQGLAQMGQAANQGFQGTGQGLQGTGQGLQGTGQGFQGQMATANVMARDALPVARAKLAPRPRPTANVMARDALPVGRAKLATRPRPMARPNRMGRGFILPGT